MILGFFFGDGSCGEYNCPSGKKASWALNNASLKLIDKYLDLCKKVYKNFDWVSMPTLESSGVYKISPKSSKYGSIVEFVKMYRLLMYHDKSKIIPFYSCLFSIKQSISFSAHSIISAFIQHIYIF